MTMISLFDEDLDNCIEVMEDFIITREQELSDTNARQEDWDKMIPYNRTLNNLKYVKSIYGN